MKSNKLELQNIEKYFSGNKVLNDINISFKHGELHALIGENGAGKSTIIKIISGVYCADHGNIYLDGKLVRFLTPTDAQKAGISTMYQETQEIPDMCVFENIFLGREILYSKSLIINRKLMRDKALEYLSNLGLKISPDDKMSELSVSQRKLIELVRAYMQNSSVIIMDEPTANLNSEETQILFQIIDEMKSKGSTIIYISHRMQEIFSLADRVTILRDGNLIATIDSEHYDENRIISMMIGREISDMYPNRNNFIGEPRLCVKELTLPGSFKDVTFTVHSGEIVGLVGFDASGANEVTKALYGLKHPTKGMIFYNGVEKQMKNPSESIKNKIAFLPEDRKTQGLFLDQNLVSNITISSLKSKYSKKSFIRKKEELTDTKEIIGKIKIKANDISSKPEELSGGNQQKVLFARWLMDKYNLLILEEPTRGVDIGAKAEIYLLMNQLANAGMAILMYSSEMTELLGMCDRILVFSRGHLTASLDREEATQELILQNEMVKVKNNEN